MWSLPSLWSYDSFDNTAEQVFVSSNQILLTTQFEVPESIAIFKNITAHLVCEKSIVNLYASLITCLLIYVFRNLFSTKFEIFLLLFILGTMKEIICFAWKMQAWSTVRSIRYLIVKFESKYVLYECLGPNIDAS